KCKICGVSFLVAGSIQKAGGPAAPAVGGPGLTDSGPGRRPVETPSNPRPAGIEVEGLDDSEWAVTSVVTVEADSESVIEVPSSASSSSMPAPSVTTTLTDPPTYHGVGGRVKQYKLLTPRDRFFDGKFSLEALEEALNHFARQGWVVRGIATPHVAGFTG